MQGGGIMEAFIPLIIIAPTCPRASSVSLFQAILYTKRLGAWEPYYLGLNPGLVTSSHDSVPFKQWVEVTH